MSVSKNNTVPVDTCKKDDGDVDVVADLIHILNSKNLNIPGFYIKKPNNKPNVYTMQDHLPNIEKLIAENPDVIHFGPMNEIEYSSNITCVDPRFDFNDSRILQRYRYYFNGQAQLYLDSNDDVSIEFHDVNSRVFMANIVTRIDYFTDDISTVDIATMKLKLAKENFTYFNSRYSLTGSIEVACPEFKWPQKKPLQYSRLRHFVYWSIKINIPDKRKSFVFRIAFRKNETNASTKNHYECNIECEDPEMNGKQFVKCFDVFYKYYKYMYIVQHGLMSPLLLENDEKYNYDINILASILTGDQFLILKSMEYIRDDDIEKIQYDGDYANEPKISNEMTTLVKTIGMDAYRQYVPVENDDIPTTDDDINLKTADSYGLGNSPLYNDIHAMIEQEETANQKSKCKGCDNHDSCDKDETNSNHDVDEFVKSISNDLPIQDLFCCDDLDMFDTGSKNDDLTNSNDSRCDYSNDCRDKYLNNIENESKREKCNTFNDKCLNNFKTESKINNSNVNESISTLSGAVIRKYDNIINNNNDDDDTFKNCKRIKL
ncbi:putative gp43-like protein [Esparto virus]|uniref:Putative gp43-like protein n=1 Tax=Esparto virus TaxID=2072209 RepID=A0A2I7G2V0_9VIRU|nr:putative gp43-like protein [Esparto virus]AUQ43960.1 putative gp43-like protein [Esparto virus]